MKKFNKITIFAFIILIIGLVLLVFNYKNANLCIFNKNIHVKGIVNKIKKDNKDLVLQDEDYIIEKFNFKDVHSLDLDISGANINLEESSTDDVNIEIKRLNRKSPTIEFSNGKLSILSKFKKLKLDDTHSLEITITAPFKKINNLDIEFNLSNILIKSIYLNENNIEISASNINIINSNLKNIEMELNAATLFLENSFVDNLSLDMNAAYISANNVTFNNLKIEANATSIEMDKVIFNGKNYIKPELSTIMIHTDENNKSIILNKNKIKTTDYENFILINNNFATHVEID